MKGDKRMSKYIIEDEKRENIRNENLAGKMKRKLMNMEEWRNDKIEENKRI